jgi:hypothetical protein
MLPKWMSTLLASLCLTLTLAGCGGVETADEIPQSGGVESVEQNLEPLPMCLPGDSLVYWQEVATACGTCTVSRKPGQYTNGYAACSSNISGTRALISRTCGVCELL